MRIIKRNLKLLICYSAKELVMMLLEKNVPKIQSVIGTNSQQQVELVNSLALASANNRDEHELWAAIFGLTTEFGADCEFCFNLKDGFNATIDSLNSYDDLIRYKDDPPDIIVMTKDGSFEFELKRFTEEVNKDNLLKFVTSKIPIYSEPYNLLIILQPRTSNPISFDDFHFLSKNIKIKDIRGKIGKICFSCNANSQDFLMIHVYPDFKVFRTPSENGSQQVSNILR